MKPEVLLRAKTLRTVQPFKAKLSASVQASASTTRLRMIVPTAIFDKMYRAGVDSISPRSDVYGTAEEGIVICLSAQGSSKVDRQTKNTVYFTFGSKAIGAVENRVDGTEIDAVIATYDDDSRYILTGPLPDHFLSTVARDRRRKNENFTPLAAAAVAFEAAGLKMPQLRISDKSSVQTSPPAPIASVADETTAHATTKTTASPVITHDEAATGTAAGAFFERFSEGAKSVNDLGEMLQMLNAERERLEEIGLAKVTFRIDESGKVRATADVRATLEM